MRCQHRPAAEDEGDRSILTSFWVEYVVQETPSGWLLEAARPDRDGEGGEPTNRFTSHMYQNEAAARTAAETRLHELRSGVGLGQFEASLRMPRPEQAAGDGTGSAAPGKRCRQPWRLDPVAH